MQASQDAEGAINRNALYSSMDQPYIMDIIKDKEAPNIFYINNSNYPVYIIKIRHKVPNTMNRIPSVVSTNGNANTNSNIDNQQEVLSVEAAAKKYFLITPADTAKNINSEFGIEPEVQLAMANGNTQFIIELAR